MRILLTMNLPYFPTRGGANKANRILLESLVREGHHAMAVVPALGTPSPITYAQFCQQIEATGATLNTKNGVDVFGLNGVQVWAVSDPSLLRTHLVSAIETFRPDWVVVSTEDASHNLLDAALRCCPDRVVYLVHSISFLPFGPLSFFPSPVRAKLIERVAAIVAVSDFVGDYLQHWGGLKSTTIHMPAYGPGPFPLLGSYGNPFVTFINPCVIKGLPIFLGLAKSMPDVQFATVPAWGTTVDDRATLETLQNVAILESFDNIDDLLAQTRVLLVPSLWGEGFPLVVVEAMLRGIPVLASDTGGTREAKLGTDFVLPVAGINRFTDRLDENMLPIPEVPEQDISPWHDALGRSLSDPELYWRQSKCSRDRALDFVSHLNDVSFATFLGHLAATTIKSQSGRQDRHLSNKISPREDLSRDVADLSPEQRSLLLLRLRKRASIRSSDKPDPIPRAPRDQPLPLSFAQQRLWFLDRLEPNIALYNVPAAVRLAGLLDIPALTRALNEIARRHEILRTKFVEISGQPVQVVFPSISFHFPLLDLVELLVERQEAAVLKLFSDEALRRFTLESSPGWRAQLLRLSESEHVLLLTMHHIVTDGWSLGILLKELSELYESYARGETSRLPELPVQYADYAVWQREWLQREVLEKQMRYWRERLEGSPALLEMPTDRSRPIIESHRGSHQSFVLAGGLRWQLRELSRREGVTLFMTLLAGFQALLGRYSGQKDICVGTGIANRRSAELEGLIGFFINTLVLRTDLSGDPSFLELLGRVREVALGAYAHQDLPFEYLVEQLRPARSLSQTPLFQVMFLLQNAPTTALELPGLRLSPVATEIGVVRFDLTLSLNEVNEDLVGTIAYNTDLYERETIDRLIDHYKRLLEQVCVEPGLKLGVVRLLSESEERQMLVEWNETGMEYPREASIPELFERQVELSPEAIAVICGEEQLSYRELNERANQVAHYLRGRGIGREEVVGVCVERSVVLVVSIIGILKAGGVYLPLDPGYPPERLELMLREARVELCLTLERQLEGLPECSVSYLCLDREWVNLVTLPVENLEWPIDPQNLAYINYTSGSTGRPKGIAIPQQAVARLVCNTNYIRLSSEDRVAQVSNASFDAVTFEIWGALLNGGQLIILRRSVTLETKEMAEELERNQISVLFLTTALFNEMARQFPGALAGVKQLLFGGEKVEPRWVRRVKEEGREQRLLHVYGPTESTTFATWYEVEEVVEEGTIAIGRGVSNTQVYVLDEELKAVPVGVIGELYLGGDGLARGYVQGAELTAERFVPDPFRGEGERLYRTGDLVRYRRDGNIEYVGRRDQQVKIRGYRIELGEIEAVLREHPAAREAVVICREDESGEKRLIGYLVCEEGVAGGSWRNYLKGRLPEYMIPSAYVELEKLPLTSTGKVDRRGLPAPEQTSCEREGVTAVPRTLTEELLAGIWCEVLGLREVGIDDNFFDLGGHSLLATRVMSRIRDAFRIEVPLRELFEHPTVSSLAISIEAAKMNGLSLTLPPIKRYPGNGISPLSFAQQRLWFLSRLEPESSVYNIHSAVRLHGLLNFSALESSFNEIIRRHEILRSCFPSIDDVPMQQVIVDQPFVIAHVDLRALDEAERDRQVTRIATDQAARHFDLSQGPIIRVQLIGLSNQEHVLLLTVHHIAFDGWSAGILMGELRALYQAYCDGSSSTLAELPFQYADFARWQRLWLKDETLDQLLCYWKQALAGQSKAFEFPTDRPRPNVLSSDGASEPLILSTETSAGLIALSRSRNATPFMTLLAAFQTMLFRYTGECAICVGTPIAGRTAVELEPVIGFFINMLALQINLTGAFTFSQVLDRVKEVVLGAYTHQHLPFEKLVDALEIERTLSRSPIFQVVFALQNIPQPMIELSGLKISSVEVKTSTAKYDLTLGMIETGQVITGSLVYNTNLFDRITIRRLLDNFVALLESVISAADSPLWSLSLLSSAEQQQLQNWNKTATDYPRENLVHQLFEIEVERAGNSIAIVSETDQISYRELNRRANCLAYRLREIGVEPDAVVGIHLVMGIPQVVAALAIVKAGGAYLPLDPSHPRERCLSMLKQARAHTLIIDDDLNGEWKQHFDQIICLNTDWSSIASIDAPNPQCPLDGKNLAYVIYTSGSTGKPKGVAIQHSSLVNLVAWHQREFSVSSTDRATCLAGVSFDAAVWEIWPYLASGASLYVPPDEMRRKIPELVCWIADNHITVSFLPTPLAEEVLRESWPEHLRLRLLLTGGDRLHFGAPTGLPFQVVNNYGPTENTVVTTTTWLDAGSREIPSIGRPIANTQVYLLGTDFALIPVGGIGELCIAGDGLARCYLHQPAFTAERFLPNPFAESPGDRIYRTGDLGRYGANGCVEYIGRVDQQVKIRGCRIELGEIEAALVAHTAINHAVVLVREDESGRQRLIAYVVSGEEPRLLEQSLRQHLRLRLPEYMIPSAFLVLTQLPLTSNGKIDKSNLPRPRVESKPGGEPRDEIERKLTEIWAQVLQLERVGINDNFFELGADSILSIQVISRANKAGLQLTPRQIFQYQTIAELATAARVAKVEAAEHDSVEGIVQALNQKSAAQDKERATGAYSKANAVQSSVLFDHVNPTSSSLVPIQPDGNQWPLFFVHPASGNVFCYTALARHLGLNQPFFGLQSPGLWTDKLFYTEIGAMSEHYIDVMRTIQPTGPYFLGGWSMGGLIAFEMACQLVDQGEKIGLLVMLDSTAMIHGECTNLSLDGSLMVRFALHLGLPPDIVMVLEDNLRRQSRQECLDTILAHSQRLGIIPTTVESATLVDLLSIFEANSQAILQYVPKTFEGEVVLFRAEKSLNQQSINAADPTLGWDQLATLGVKIHSVPGDHFSIIREPHVGLVSEKLRARLEEASRALRQVGVTPAKVGWAQHTTMPSAILPL